METKDKIDLVLQNRSDSETWIQGSGKKNEFKVWHDQYHSIPATKPYVWMSNKFIPLTFRTVETAVSQILGVLFSQNPPFEVRPRENSDTEQARMIQKLISYQFDESNYYGEFEKFVRQLAIYGTSFGKIVWDVKFKEEVKWQEQFQPIMSIFGMPVGQRSLGMFPQAQYSKVYGCPRFITCNIGDIFPDPTSIEIEDGWIIHRTRRSLDYLKRMHASYPEAYNEEVLKIEKGDTTENKEAKLQQDIQISMDIYQTPQVKRQDTEGGVEILERWGLAEQDGQLVSWLYRVAAGKYLITDMPNPYWHKQNPFVKGSYLKQVNSFYGLGISEILNDIQNNINEIFNQRNDNISLSLNKPAVYRKNVINPKNIVLAPGRTIGVDDSIADSLQFVEIPDYTRDSVIHTEELKRWAQEATGVTSLTLGVAGNDQNDTATGMSLLSRASGERFMTIAKSVENDVFEKSIRMYYQLDYQYIELPEMVRIVGEKGNTWAKVDPDTVRRDYDFVPSGVFSMENKGQKALRVLQFYNILKGNPIAKETALLKKLFYLLELGDDPSELIRDDAEMQQIMQIAQMMAMKMVQDLAGQQSAQLKGGDKGVKTPGMNNNSGQFKGSEMPGTPGVPPVSPAVPPGERI